MIPSIYIPLCSAHNIQHSFPRLSHDYEGSLDPFAYYAEQLHVCFSYGFQLQDLRNSQNQ